MLALAAYMAQAVVISLSGVMAPGPITAATLAAGARRRHAGAWLALGHGVIEFPLMGLIVLGAGTFLEARSFRITVGLAGGVILLLLALLTLGSLRQAQTPDQPPARQVHPFWSGIMLTGGNPYFLLWWATVGLAISTRGLKMGLLAFVLFAIVHWLCDLFWLETLSIASHQGVNLLGPRGRRAITALCAAAMALFGGWFLVDALRQVV